MWYYKASKKRYNKMEGKMKKSLKVFTMFLMLTLTVLFTGCGSSDAVQTVLSNPVISAISGNLNSSVPTPAPMKGANKAVANAATVQLIFGGVDLGTVTTDANGFFKFEIKTLDLASNASLLPLIESGDFATAATALNVEDLLLQFKATVGANEYNFYLPPTILSHDAETALGNIEIAQDTSGSAAPTDVVVKLGNALGGGITELKVYKATDTIDYTAILSELENAETALENLVIPTELGTEGDVTTAVAAVTTFVKSDISSVLEVFNLTEVTTTEGTYVHTTYNNGTTAPVISEGTYEISSLVDIDDDLTTGTDEGVHTFTLLFTATNGVAAPANMALDFSDRATAGALDITTDVNSIYDLWITTKFAKAYTSKFAETSSDDRGIVDLKNSKLYYWEQELGQEETFDNSTITVTEIPGGYQIVEPTGFTSILYPLTHFHPDFAGLRIEIENGTYTINEFSFKESENLTDNKIFENQTYCAYIKDPRTIAGSPTWEQLLIMDFTGSALSMQMYEDGQTGNIVQMTGTYLNIDEKLNILTDSNGTDYPGILTNVDITNKTLAFENINSNALYYKTEAFVDADISGKVLTLTSTSFDTSTDLGAMAPMTFTATTVTSADLTAPATWAITNGNLVITEGDGTISTCIKLAYSNAHYYRMFIKTVEADSSSTISRGYAGVGTVTP
jgi:hypothetical protein